MCEPCRPDFDAPWKGLPDVATIARSRLDHIQLEALVERVSARRRLPAKALTEIVAQNDGAPLFVEELTKSLLESGLRIAPRLVQLHHQPKELEMNSIQLSDDAFRNARSAQASDIKLEVVVANSEFAVFP